MKLNLIGVLIILVVAAFFVSSVSGNSVIGKAFTGPQPENGAEPLFNRTAAPLGCTVDGDCKNDRFVGAFFCQNGDVYRNYKDFFCSNQTEQCSFSTYPQLVEQCHVQGEVCIEGEGTCLPGSENGTRMAFYNDVTFNITDMEFVVHIFEPNEVANVATPVAVYAYRNSDYRDMGTLSLQTGNGFNGDWLHVVSDYVSWTDVDPTKGWYIVWKDKQNNFWHLGEDGDIYASYQEVQQDTIPFDGISESCTDTDGGTVYDIKGTVSGYNVENGTFSYTDTCQSNTELQEYYCIDDVYANGNGFSCVQFGYDACVDGACVYTNSTGNQTNGTI